jgi:hypothetical protein
MLFNKRVIKRIFLFAFFSKFYESGQVTEAEVFGIDEKVLQICALKSHGRSKFE